MNDALHLNVEELDVFACPLDGVNQIEASAGTGKTWNICALYVRLLLEKKLAADQILVVTFTKAATAELHERIRARLAELAHAIENGDAAGDPFIERLFETTLAEVDHDEALKRVHIALHTFDQAAIHTIHAFCQRALQEAPFAAAMPFALEMEADDSALRFELAADFWRERVEPAAARERSFASWLVAKGAGPGSLDAQLARRLKKPLAALRWGDLDAVALADAQAIFDTACALWHAERDGIANLLLEAEAKLSKTTHKRALIEAAIKAWGEYFANADCYAPPPQEALKLTATALKKGTKVKHEPPEHAFFDHADSLAAAAQAAEAAQRALWLDIVREWLDYAPEELAARKRTRRVVSFNDLLSNLYHALTKHAWLADALRARYPAALIDEFQDTDPLQFAIFNRVFAPAGPLFLVGDPKQAIYSFRAADLHTYLKAREAASARYTLAVNQRSTAPIIDACNRVFSANPAAFILGGLDYQPVRAGTRQRPPFIDNTPAAAWSDTADFCVWMLPQGDSVLTKNRAQRDAAEACAAEIVRLLRGAQKGEVTIGDEPLSPGRIAVLVQTHRQGSLVKRVLAAWGVGSVELAQASVFGTLDAEQIERVLAAIDTPGDLRRLRAALATDWLGLDAAALWRLEHADSADAASEAMSWVERFSRYRTLWHERGFAVMWRTLARELRIAERLVAGVDGERRLTNVNHLAELLQARGAAQPGIAPTLRWLAAQRAEEGTADEAQLRLESDRNLVQIVTVHKSKGLEYAVVFCPFLNDGSLREPPSSGLPDAKEYHDDAGDAVLHYGIDEEAEQRAKASMAREAAAERARLVYVALTRAVYRCYVVGGVYLVGKNSTKEARRSVLNWLVAGKGHEFGAWLAEPPAETEVLAGWQALAAQSNGSITLEPLPVIEAREPLVNPRGSEHALAARASRRLLRDRWRMASFSSLIAAGARDESNQPQPADARPDHDEFVDAIDALQAGATPPREKAVLADDDILAFPRGPAAGECLHRMYELADFTAPETWPKAIDRALREHPTPAPEAIARHLPSMMLRLVADTVATELVPGMRLASIGPKRRMNELEFLFPAQALDFAALRRLLAAHGFPDVALEAGTLRGFVKGFIDMIVEHDGRFWIIDWKSNHLGDTPADYDAASLDEAMASHAYHLQALFYVVALHRYLRSRLAGYAYQTHIGGYLYLFVRGVRPGWLDGTRAAGVHAALPGRELVEALDRLMSGGTA
ncbi:exodeoxyribonuclease V subunit beta [Caballeronia terrestris]|uniref:RecBCD enzyme subunit RecB n=1 Tax=Caballeronia terrestris TaxID=1226301 RepID=A0A158I5F2_9BURK|nr:exodeoxyribonuclease V subunit beta [Caballeronia terrestris]SAL51341.1 exodeoxyribonuclease V subunit beta [Caballeronia terrestris]